MVMENFNSKKVDPDIADSIDFMVENVSWYSSKLTGNVSITLISVLQFIFSWIALKGTHLPPDWLSTV